MRWFKLTSLMSILVLSMALAGTSVVWAQQGHRPTMAPSGYITTGRLEYRAHCASCHGPTGKGNGPVAAALTPKPADLTILAKNNKGVFPEKKVEAFINGSEMIAAHGSRAMPVWGDVFSKPYTVGAQPGHTPQEVQQRIGLLVDYIKSIQEK